jgi:2,5-diketo-D-gluconate reductase B
MTAETVPEVGLGTWEHTDAEACIASVATALESGYRHVDTAQVYGTEQYVGEGLRRADVPREEVYLATKIHDDDPGYGYREVRAGAEARLEALGVDSLELLYVHWPVGEYEAADTLPRYDALVEDGLVEGVGLSNFTPELLDEARDVLDHEVVAHQVEIHPFLKQDHLVEYAVEHDHRLVAYSPLARGDVFENDTLRAIAEKHGVSAARVSLSWLLSKLNVSVVPKATGVDHLRDNLAARDLELDPEDIERIDAIEREERYVDRPEAPWHERS